MVYFNVVSGLASIASLCLSIWALFRVHSIEVKLGFTKISRTSVKQKANGRDIRQAGGDIHG